MHRTLKTATAAVVFAVCAIPLAAPAQQSDHQEQVRVGWSAEQRADYDNWPVDQRDYFWTLSHNQMIAWWKLDPLLRAQILAINPDQRALVWAEIEARLAAGVAMPVVQAAPGIAIAQPAPAVIQANPVGSSDPPTPVPPNPSSAQAPVPPALPADPSYNAGPYKGALTAPPPEAFNKVYPVCTKTRQGNCRNRNGV